MSGYYLIIAPPHVRVQTATSQVDTPMTQHYSPEGDTSHDHGDEDLGGVHDIGSHGFSGDDYHNCPDEAEDHQPSFPETVVDAVDSSQNQPSKSPEVHEPKPSTEVGPGPSKAGGPAAEGPVATPCRSAQTGGVASPGSRASGEVDVGTPSSVASIDDKSVEAPTPGELRLSQNAINLRLQRVMRVDSKGSCKVSEEIRKQFHCKKGKLRLQQIFQSCGFNPDKCDKKLG